MMANAGNNRAKGLAFVLTSSFSFACTGIIGKYLLNLGLSPLFVFVCRNSFSLLAMTMILLFYNRDWFAVKKEDRKTFLLLLIFTFFYGLGYIFGLNYLNVSVAVVILYTYPAIIAVASIFIFKEKLTLRILIALFLTFFGILFTLEIFSGVGEISLIGCLLVLCGSLGAAGYAMTSKRLTEKYNTLTINFYAFAGSLLPLLWAIPVLWPHPFPGMAPFVWIAFMGLIPYACAFLLYAASLRYLKASEAGIIATSEPVFSILMAGFILREIISASQILGAVLVIAAILLLQLNGVLVKRVN